jgi:hypothetical protein
MTDGPLTCYVTIGNSDGRLSQPRYSHFYSDVDHAIRSRASKVFGAWISSSVDSHGPNACWSFTLNEPFEAVAAALKSRLSAIAAEYEQEAIVYTITPVEMIGPPSLVIDGAGVTIHGGTVTGSLTVKAQTVEDGPLLRPRDWEHIFHVQVHDPDGWRATARGGPKDWEERISEEEWHDRANQSTVNTRPLEQSFVHNPWDSLCGRNGFGEPTHPKARCRTCNPRPEDHTHIGGRPVSAS